MNPDDSPLSGLGLEYALAGLHERDLDPDPFKQFDGWLRAAMARNLTEPTAMTLATADAAGRPSARVVLLKHVDVRGLVFYTNYESHKGRDLAANPQAAAVFYWADLERQVRLSGTVERISRAESQAYFHTRPFGARLAACVSRQSEVVPDRETLDRALSELAKQYADERVPLPPHWGGYRLAPDEIEFWQGRLNRMHDRLRYRRTSGPEWVIERLSP